MRNMNRRIDNVARQRARRCRGGKPLVVFFANPETGEVHDLETKELLTPEAIVELEKTKKVIIVRFTQPEVIGKVVRRKDHENDRKTDLPI